MCRFTYLTRLCWIINFFYLWSVERGFHMRVAFELNIPLPSSAADRDSCLRARLWDPGDVDSWRSPQSEEEGIVLCHALDTAERLQHHLLAVSAASQQWLNLLLKFYLERNFEKPQKHQCLKFLSLDVSLFTHSLCFYLIARKWQSLSS